jgi:hypothetical protein
MNTLRAPSGASHSLAHAVELINRDLDGLVDHLDKHQQDEFWTGLHQYSLAQTQNPAQNAKLITSERVNRAVREALEIADEKLTTHLRDVRNEADRTRLWQMLHEACEEQIRQTKQPKARHGGGGQSA